MKGVDDNVKRLIDYLRDAGELDNTVIIYTGDQGFFLGEHDLMDKRWMYEEAMRMPFIVHYPEGRQSRLDERLADQQHRLRADHAGTGRRQDARLHAGPQFRRGAAGRATTGRLADGHLLPLLDAHGAQPRVPAHFGIRTERYKLIFFYGCTPTGEAKTPAAWEFYDLENDPCEMHNQYANAEYADGCRRSRSGNSGRRGPPSTKGTATTRLSRRSLSAMVMRPMTKM